MSDIIIQLEAYRLIRKKVRNMVEPVDDETLGSYVRGIVDLQTELYGINQQNKENEKSTLLRKEI